LSLQYILMKPGTVVFQGKTQKGLLITVRYPKSTDLKACLRYINVLSKEKTYINIQGEVITLAHERKWLAAVLKNIKKNKAINLLAFSDNKLIGWVTLEKQEKVTRHMAVFGITVAKEYRGQGVGRLLMELLLKEVEQHPDIEIVTLSMFANNDMALKLYQSFGFMEYGRLPKGVLTVDNEHIDHVYLYKMMR
jgi:ribosomal protein S18 acetylase RimI-like enzyme